ncbi:MAG: hypothetical protein JSS86_01535 [Cyanobacteria bacterium SZAS LIN-2]|nr:hypothetical protein [Cyanobacteria bacterium SZAS LIN-2]
MNSSHRQAQTLLILGAVLCLATQPLLAKEEKWTIDSRANKLMQEINEGQKRGDLTVKEAKKLRSDLADIAHRKHEMKGDNQGKVSPKDRLKIEADLNKVSTKIHKLELEKRVKHH